jgi:hypothetical protein
LAWRPARGCAGTRVGDHDGRAAAGQQSFNILLKLEVERQIDIAPGLRRHLFQLANHAATVVDFNLFIAGLTVQDIFVIALDSQLADIVRGGVVGQLASLSRRSTSLSLIFET